jgi:curved DNA-binding protein CbpA
MRVDESQLSRWKHAYQVLGVPLAASASSIRQAQRRLVKRWHPDLYQVGTQGQTDATHMTVLINEAYAAIERAPLRYFVEAPSETSPRPQKQAPAQSPDSKNESTDLRIPNMARIEFWVRFVCGALFGIFVSLDLTFSGFWDAGQYSRSLAVGFLAFILACGFASARYGDKFWYLVFRHWWLWP